MQALNQNQCDLCYSYGRLRQVYMNPKCGHKYCKNCLYNRHVPDENKIKCFVRNCMSSINVDEMDDHFIQLQLQQLDQIQIEKKETCPIQDDKINAIKNNDENKSIKSKDQIPYSQEKKNKLGSEIKKQKQSDTTEFCGYCLIHLVNKIEQKKQSFCKIHQLCFACQYKQIFEKRKQNHYIYQYNYSNQTIDCQICDRWPGSY